VSVVMFVSPIWIRVRLPLPTWKKVILGLLTTTLSLANFLCEGD
jgi:hypothetical protein